jgi:hypothetical protein
METPTVEVKGIKGLIGRKVSKEVDFMSTKVKISKLSVEQVLDVQEKAKQIQVKAIAAEKTAKADLDNGTITVNVDDSDESLVIMRTVIGYSVEGGDQMTEADYKGFPLEDLSKLSGEIMKFSGLGSDAGK